MEEDKSISPAPTLSPQPSQYLFVDALRLIMEGKKVTKVEWNNQEFYGLLRDNYLMLHKPDGKYYQWVLTDGDLFGEDWIILSDEN